MSQKLKRITAALLAAVTVMLSLWSDVRTISAAPATDIPASMINNKVLDSLAYLGYDVAGQINDGSIYVKWGEAATAYAKTGIGYTYSGMSPGTETTPAGLPDVAAFRSKGWQCGSFVTYYLFNYLPNVAKFDTSMLARPASGSEYSPGAYHAVADQWVSDGYASKVYTAPAGANFSEGYIAAGKKLIPGDIVIQTGLTSSGTYSEWSAGHIAVYLGEYAGQHFLAHIGGTRGPEINTIENLQNSNNGSGKAARYVTAIYHINFYEAAYGYIEVNKKDQDGNGLAGAVFTAINVDTNYKCIIGPTDDNGYARSDINADLPYGTYIVTETTFPEGYEASGQTSWTVTVDDTTNGRATVNAVNKKKTGTGQVIKTSEDGVIEGVSFTITGNGVSQTLLTDATGRLTASLAPGIYTVTENASDIYVPAASQDITVTAGGTAQVTFNNVLKRGRVRVVKTATDDNVKGRKIHLYGTSLSGATVDEEAVTDEDGVAVFENILIGNYTIEENDVPAWYITPAAQSITVEWNETAQATVHNELMTGAVKVVKTATDGVVQGRKFHLYGTSYSGAAVDEYSTTGEDGIAQFTGVPISEPGKPYTIEEVEVPDRYITPAAQTVDVKHNETSGVTFVNKVIKGTITLTKVNAEYPQNRLSGAVFTVRRIEDNNKTVVGTMSEGVKGVYTITDLAYGKYEVEETKAPEGFERDTNVYTVNITQDGMVYEVENTAGEGFANKPQKGSLRVIKTSEDNMVSGITFRLTGTSLLGETVDMIAVTDENGVVEFLNVPVSDAARPYILSEENVKEYYVAPDTREVVIEWGITAEATFNNALKRGNLTVRKEAEDGIIKGVKFHLYGTSLSGAAVDEYATTGEDGIARFLNILISGSEPYTIEEVEVADRYIIPEPQKVFITYDESGSTYQTASLVNVLKRGDIAINKVSSKNPDEPVSYAEFAVYHDVDGDGELTEHDEFVSYMFEQETGLYTLQNLVYGDYLVRETRAPGGYHIDNNVYQVAIRDNGAVYNVTNSDGGVFVNEPEEILTGDSTNAAIWIILAAAAGCLMVITLLLKKKKV